MVGTVASTVDMPGEGAEGLTRLAAEQSALRRVATLVAQRASEVETVAAVTSEVGSLFDADTANTLRWDGEALRVVGDWYRDGREGRAGQVYLFGGDTISVRVIEAAGPARVDSRDDLRTDFARARWDELGLESSIGAPVIVDGEVWGVVTASRFRGAPPFPERAEHDLGDFAMLCALAIENAAWRHSMSELLDEQLALRRIATLVAGGRPADEVMNEVVRHVGTLFDARRVDVVRWDGVQNEVTILRGWTAGAEEPPKAGTTMAVHPQSALIQMLETGLATRTHGGGGPNASAVAAPLITNAALWGGVVAERALAKPFPPATESRLRSFADLAAQAVSNELAQEDIRRSRERIVREGDAARQRLERNLHDGAQQRLVAVSMQLRVAAKHLAAEPERARELLDSSIDELGHAMEELRDLARGLHPALLTERGLGPALEVLARRASVPVALRCDVPNDLPTSAAAAAYYVVAEALTNTAKYANASSAEVAARATGGGIYVDVADDGAGGARISEGSGLLNLSDRVAALGGRFTIESPHGGGTTVRAFIPLPDRELADGTTRP
jgi:signal transduction histidine kinase